VSRPTVGANTELAKARLALVSQVRGSENQIVWTTFSLFAAAEGVLASGFARNSPMTREH